MTADLPRLSRFLALVLRHQAAEHGLTLDAEGYTDVDAVWALIVAHFGAAYTRADLEAVVAGDRQGKRRYEIVGGRIRALYGHGAVSAVSYPPAVPPALLYHGTSRLALESILRAGLHTGTRQYVHLTSSLARAASVGGRQPGETVIVHVHALQAHADGVLFYQPEPEHWLARHIPPDYLSAE